VTSKPIANVIEDPSGLNYVTTFARDALNNFTLVTQASQTRTTVYDSLKRLSRATNPGRTTTSYNLRGGISLTCASRC
jgi:YD repeat-containing protein